MTKTKQETLNMKKLFKNLAYASVATVFGCAILENAVAAAQNGAINVSTSAHRGIYIDGNGGWGYINVNSNDYSDPFTGAPATSVNNNSFAWSADAGFQFNKNIGIEEGYISFGTARANTTFSSQKDTFGGFDAMLKGILPVNNRCGFLIKIGAADMNDDGSATVVGVSGQGDGSTWTPLFGLGTFYEFTPGFTVNLQDIYSVKTNYTKDNLNLAIPDLNALMLGLSYKFSV